MNQVDRYRRTRSWRPAALAAALSLALVGVAAAQSNASGVIFGNAGSAAGATIHLENLNTGLARDITVESNGRYRATSLPVGTYKVTLQRGGKVVATRENVQVRLGSGTDVSFGESNATTLEGLTVMANALPAIDVSSVDSRTVLTAEQLAKLPLSRDVTSAALLAPGTVQGDSRYGNVASFGGSSASENQYYINGYAVTNALTGIGFTSLPYDAIDQQQIFTGGYGAEYGRSTGGVINVVTKRGGNTWMAGVGLHYTPDALRSTPKSIYRTNGQLYQNRGDDENTAAQYTGYISGPLIKDRLFMYAAGDFTRTSGKTISSILAPQSTNEVSKAQKWLVKVDWNIIDSHILEFTGLSDQTRTDRTVYEYDYGDQSRGALIGTDKLKNAASLAGSAPGGDVYVGKYTGYLTDNLTVNALYGTSRSTHKRTLGYAGNPNCPWITDARSGISDPITGCGLVNGTVLGPGAEDKTHGWRLDVEYQLGAHDLRAGVDNQTLESSSGNQYEGGYRWRYQNVRDVSGRPDILPDVPAGTDYFVENRTFITGASVKVEQEAQFIEDRWQVSDRWMAYIGLRNEQFKNINGAGETYVKQRHQLAPRLGVTWDVFGDSTFKVYANAGRYHLAIPSNVAIRGASASLYSSQYFTYDGVAPNGEPLNLVPAGSKIFLNGEDGTDLNPKTVAAQGIKAYYQDEYILGFDKSISADWSFGAKVTQRKLKSSIDDFCDSRPFEKYAARNNIDISNASIPGCYLFNPGEPNTFMVDVDGQGTLVPFNLTMDDFTTPAGVKFPSLKRKYYSLDLYLEHHFDARWFGRMEYTFSRSYGNSEGQLKSDIGQLDPAVTQDWDAPEIMQFANGPLPNDRTHALKTYGFFQATPEWLFGANVAIASGRPKNCIGFDPVDAIQYGASYFECNNEPAPRGSRGRLPWTYKVDLNAQYRPMWGGEAQNLAFSVSVFNLFNSQKTLSQVDGGEDPVDDYQRPLSFQTPRYVQFGVTYDFSL
jgi:hypothetical protein